MASATALFYNQNVKNNPTLELLEFSKKERPYVVQLFGSEPKHFETAVKIIEKEIKPDGIDINFGCPVPKVAKQKAGAELFKDLKKSREVIKAVIVNTNLPVSIKTRTRAGNINVLRFLDNISDLDVKAIMIHGRTLKQGFVGDIDTKIIKKARDYFGGIILANGGIESWEDAERILRETEADGLGIGRGAIGRPWIFEEVENQKSKVKSKKEIFKIAINHAKLVEKLKGEQGIVEMRKHLCAYVQGLPSAKNLRNELVKVEKLKDIKNIFNKFSRN
jgi:tRNA-dihydrouridine synthase B